MSEAIARIDPRLSTAILAGKLVRLASRRLGFGGGTALPGAVAGWLDSEALSKLACALPGGSVLVTGTNGKTTTSHLLASFLAADRRKVIHNRTGANLRSGLLTALVEGADLLGRSSFGGALFEVDEAVMPSVARATGASVIILTNLFRDQLDRYGEVDYVASVWRNAVADLPSSTTLILNADDPAVAALGRLTKANVVYFGIDAPGDSVRVGHNADARNCPFCGQALTYSVVRYAHIGSYQCPSGDFQRPTPSIAARVIVSSGVEATELDVAGSFGVRAWRFKLPGLYNVYNLLAAVAAALALGVSIDQIGGALEGFSAAFGRLERMGIEIVTKAGRKVRLLDEVDVITGISGGSFTALAYGLYGEKLFDEYEKRFLKRDVQGELVRRVLNPGNWGALSSTGWGRSELAANLYDEILFNGATFADLERTAGPAIAVSATEIATGSRMVFVQQDFDVMCADLSTFRLARAAAASSAVPVVLSPLTINNYGGSCGYQEPAWLRPFAEAAKPPRPAGRLLKRLQELRELDDAVEDPYFHLVDGAVSDNLGLRGVLDFLETFEALRAAGQPTPLDHVRRIIIFVVNSVSVPSNEWSKSENPPGTLSILTKAAGLPVDRYASESVELLRDIDARWEGLRATRDSVAFDKDKDPTLARVVNAPNADIYVIEVAFQAMKDKAERDYLNELPTSFVLPPEAVDRLRAAAATIILDSPDFQQMLNDAGARVVDRPITTPPALPSASTTPVAPPAAK